MNDMSGFNFNFSNVKGLLELLALSLTIYGCYIDKLQVSSFHSYPLCIVLSLVTVKYFQEFYLTYCRECKGILLTRDIFF